MPDIALITTILTSLKGAIDIAKLLQESDLSLEKAELKLKLAEIMSAVAEAKIQLAEVQDILIQKDKRIGELEEAFESKDMLIRSGDAFYATDANGKPTGNAYCLRCWEVDHRKRQLVLDSENRFSSVCTTCKQKYTGRLVPEIR